MKFTDADNTVFVSRRDDGSIYGVWTVRQFEGQEESLEDAPEVVAFTSRPLPIPGLSDGELAKVLIAKGLLKEEEVAAAVTALIEARDVDRVG